MRPKMIERVFCPSAVKDRESLLGDDIGVKLGTMNELVGVVAHGESVCASEDAVERLQSVSLQMQFPRLEVRVVADVLIHGDGVTRPVELVPVYPLDIACPRLE